MVKRGRAATPQPLALAAALAALTLAPAVRADWTVTPAVTLRETYTDNVALASGVPEEGRFVTELTPRISMLHRGRRLQTAIDYSKHLYLYSGERPAGTGSSSQQLQASATAELIDELLTLNGRAAIGQQAISAFGPQVQDNGYATANRAEVRTYSLSPSLQHRFGAVAVAQLRYSHDRVESNNGALGNSGGNNVQAAVSSGPMFRQVGWGLNYSRQRVHDTISMGSGSDSLNAQLSYNYSPQLSFNMNGGRESYDFAPQPGAEDSNSGKNWGLGLSWVPSTRTQVQFSAGRRQFGDTYFLKAVHRSRSTVWSANYNDSITTTRAEFLQSGLVSTAALLDQLFTPHIPDAAARAQAVAAYIKVNGLPPTLANSVNYFTNRYILQRQFQLGAAFNTARSTLMLSLYDNRREALSQINVDDALLGQGSRTINDNTRQTGVNAGMNWRISSRSGINLNTSYARSRSLSADHGQVSRSVSLSLTRQFPQKLSGALEVRHHRGGAALSGVPGVPPGGIAFNGGQYSENAVSASLSKQF